MDTRNKYIEDYVLNSKEKLESLGILVTKEQLNRVINRYLVSDESIEDIIKQIDKLVNSFIDDFRQSQQEQMKFMEKISDMKDLDDLLLQYTGITLNNQDIDLMLIAGANNLQELQEALSKITNINVSLNTTELTDEQFLSVRQQVYDMYLGELTPRNDYIRNRNIELVRKIQYLKSSLKITDEESTTIDNIISNSNGVTQIIERLNQVFSSEKLHLMYETIRDFSPIEKTGIKSSTLESSRNLLEQIKNNYNSITIDEESKYGKIVLQDGTFEFKHLQKSLDFAQSLGKQVRLNTLLFYMDCPESLYNLEKNEENRILVKQKLQNYVDATTRFVMDNGYGETVRSVDVFNELLNRYPMSREISYDYRGNIAQDERLYENFDNVKSGWFKHLEIEDLCDVIAVARKNMHTTDFMYNDDHLIDQGKISATMEIIGKIQAYEKSHGIKLIDSIGTQMHIDNDLSKDEMRQMIINLSSFGLPIEVTEFDMAMTKEVEELSDEQIEQLRLEKINEIYECVEELKEQCNIRGFTIWSKTDKQNFRVYLENEERIKKGLEPIETLHGGFFTENMESKILKKIKYKQFQNFNYHTHTNRCGHASISNDYEYVKYAKDNGIVQLGFSDHIPNTELEFPNVDVIKEVDENTHTEIIKKINVNNQRMHIFDVDSYISSIRNLQQENPDMKILCGFEAEFSPMKESFLCELREEVDYLILGQHFVNDGLQMIKQKNNPEYPIEYAKMVCKAMDSGLFDIVAHPDIFMQFRDSMDIENAKKFNQNAIIASRAICDKAKELGIPLELNFAGIDKNEVMKDKELSYPHSMFWKIAEETGAQVLYGVDAHTPSQFNSMIQNKEVIDRIVDTTKLNFVSKDYNPVEARKNNLKLQELYNNSMSSAFTFETNLINKFVSNVANKLSEDTDVKDISYATEVMLDEYLNKSKKEAVLNKSLIADKIDMTSSDISMSQEEKKFKLSRLKNTILQTDGVLSKRQEVIDRAKESINTAIQVGCETKEEYINVVSQLTEVKTQKDPIKRQNVTNNLENFVQNSNKQSFNTVQKEKSKVHVKSSSSVSQSNNNGNKGFTNVLSCVLVAGVMVGIAIGVGYIIHKFNN